jgi:hypothetical protein
MADNAIRFRLILKPLYQNQVDLASLHAFSASCLHSDHTPCSPLLLSSAPMPTPGMIIYFLSDIPKTAPNKPLELKLAI